MYREGLEWTLFDSPVNLLEVTTPTVVEEDTLKLYAKDKSGVSSLYYIGDDLVEHNVGNVFGGGSGVAGRVAFWNGASTLSSDADLTFSTDTLTATKLRVTTNLGVGTATPLSELEVVTTVGTLPRGITQTQYSDDGNAPGIQLRKARGAEASPTAALLDDPLGEVNFYGLTSGTTFTRTALIQAKAAENYSATNQGSYLRIYTIPTGSTTLTERWHLGPEGQLGIGGATYGGSGDIFSSGGASAAPTWVTRATLNAALDHGTLAGLTDDGHAQYALLAGRSGGQLLKGGTAVTDFLSLQSTAGVGTTDYIKFLVGNNGGTEVARMLNSGFMGVGLDAPEGRLHVRGTNAVYSTAAFTVDNSIGARMMQITNDGRVYLGGGSFGASNAVLQVDASTAIAGHSPAISAVDSSGALSLRGNSFSTSATSLGFGPNNAGSSFGLQDTLNYAVKVYGDGTNSNNVKFGIGEGAAGTPVATLDIRNFSTNVPLHIATTAGAELLNLSVGGNLAIGTASFPLTGTFGLVFADGTALATMAANTAGLYAADIVAGNSAIHALSEAGDLIKLYKTGTYTPTNVSADRSYDANSTTIDELADVLGTLITDLQLTGLIG